MHHAGDGLHFERVDGGAVRVVARAGAEPDAPVVFETTIGAAAWVALVTAVCFSGPKAGPLIAQLHREPGG